MADIIGAHLHLETIFGLMPVRNGHDAGIVDKQIDMRQPIGDAGRGARDGIEAGKIERLEGHVCSRCCCTDLGDRLLGPDLVA